MFMQRVLLKLSGEALQVTLNGGSLQEASSEARACKVLSGNDGAVPKKSSVYSAQRLQDLQEQISQLRKRGIEVGIVVGGGNIFRAKDCGIPVDRCLADRVGMAATFVNALALQAYFQAKSLPSKVYGAHAWTQVPVFEIDQVRRDLKTHVLIFAGGTGHPFFSTDTAAALRAIEINADVLLKATKVDGVYNKDPKKYSDAKRFEDLTYKDALKGQYEVMDACAFALCMEQNLPIFIFNIFEKDAILRAVDQSIKGTLIKEK